MDNSAQWPQGFGGGVVRGVDNPSSSGSIDQQQQQQKRTLARPQKDQIVNCPRCNSVNTKFCYYNNYSLSQPRYFCKTCRRYWTAGGSLRNVPVGGGSRKNRRSSSSSSSSVATNTSSVHSQASAAANNLHQGHDLNLSFPLHPTTTTTHDQYPNPTFTTTSTKPNFSMDNHLSNTTTKLLPHHLQNPNSTNMTPPLLPPMGLFKNTILAAHDPHSSREMMSSLMTNKYPLEHHQHTSNSSNTSIFSNPGFTQIHQGQFKPSSLNFSLDGFSNDNNHNELGYTASCLQLGVQQQSISDDDNVGGMRLLFPFNQQENMNNKDQHQKQVVPSASVAAGGASSDNVVRQFDHQHNMIINRSSSSSAAAAVASVDQGGNGGDHNNGSSAGFWTGMLSGGSW